MQSPASPTAEPRWPRGGLARIIVDLLYEIGGAPGERGVTVDELAKRVMDRPPQGMLYAAQKWYAVYIIARRDTPDNINAVITDDGAQGITIHDDAGGQPYFATARAVRAYLMDRLHQWSRQSGWLVRDGDRFRLLSEEAGPRVTGDGIYNAAARARLDEVDRAHAAYVNAKAALRKIDEPALAALALVASLEANHGDTYHRRRTDFLKMVDAMRKLRDPEHVREFRAKLAEQTVPR